MKLLEEKIVSDGTVLGGNILKVGSFLNQQLDTAFLAEMGKEIKRIYEADGVTKILTIEASGIAIATAAGIVMDVPVVFAKKNRTANVSGEVYTASVYSFTHKKENVITVPKEYLSADDKIVIIDDFLANGKALEGLIEIIEQAGATLVGCTCAIEKGFQGGGDGLRAKGVRVESLAIVDEMNEGTIKFRK
ncbi:MAG: xanthine phosphoribosyltransferase [Clostridia bacterium]|nr:xanthine phosphoribosyltransferase [Clostridia bacterium]